MLYQLFLQMVTIDYNSIISSVSLSKALADLLPEDSDQLSSNLCCIPSVNVATVNLLYDCKVLPRAYSNVCTLMISNDFLSQTIITGIWLPGSFTSDF